MTELLRNAWSGWFRFAEAGKLGALLLAALLYLGLSGRWREQREGRTLFFYTATMTACCILPVTAAVLMLYQTRFYDYEWLWSLVPMTAVTAWAGTDLLGRSWKGFQWNQWRKGIPVTALMLAVLALCSGLRSTEISREAQQERRERAWQVLEAVENREEVFLWAPREILEYARESDGAFKLLYGRNMWEASLGAYAYDAYPQEIQNLYLWMENVEETGNAAVEDVLRGEMLLKGESCMAEAVEAGVNCILLPGRLGAHTVKRLADSVGGSVLPLEEYYLLTL